MRKHAWLEEVFKRCLVLWCANAAEQLLQLLRLTV